MEDGQLCAAVLFVMPWMPRSAGVRGEQELAVSLSLMSKLDEHSHRLKIHWILFSHCHSHHNVGITTLVKSRIMYVMLHGTLL